MKKKRVVKRSVNKLDYSYKFVNNGDTFIKGSVCQLQSNEGDGTGWFLGLRKTGKNKARCKFDEFEIFDRDGNAIELQDEF